MKNLAVLFLFSFLLSGCAEKQTKKLADLSEYSVDAAKIKSVDTERLDSGKILKITVEGYLGDSCTQLYEDEIKTFQKPGLVHVVIPTKRKKNQACTQVISDFVRVFEIDIDPDRGMPDIVVNMRQFPR